MERGIVRIFETALNSSSNSSLDSQEMKRRAELPSEILVVSDQLELEFNKSEHRKLLYKESLVFKLKATVNFLLKDNKKKSDQLSELESEVELIKRKGKEYDRKNVNAHNQKMSEVKCKIQDYKLYIQREIRESVILNNKIRNMQETETQNSEKMLRMTEVHQSLTKNHKIFNEQMLYSQHAANAAIYKVLNTKREITEGRKGFTTSYNQLSSARQKINSKIAKHIENIANNNLDMKEKNRENQMKKDKISEEIANIEKASGAKQRIEQYLRDVDMELKVLGGFISDSCENRTGDANSKAIIIHCTGIELEELLLHEEYESLLLRQRKATSELELLKRKLAQIKEKPRKAFRQSYSLDMTFTNAPISRIHSNDKTSMTLIASLSHLILNYIEVLKIVSSIHPSKTNLFNTLISSAEHSLSNLYPKATPITESSPKVPSAFLTPLIRIFRAQNSAASVKGLAALYTDIHIKLESLFSSSKDLLLALKNYTSQVNKEPSTNPELNRKVSRRVI